MIKELKVLRTIHINAQSPQVWDALTDPDKIKLFKGHLSSRARGGPCDPDFDPGGICE